MRLAHHANAWMHAFRQADAPFDLPRLAAEAAQAGYAGIELPAQPELIGTANQVRDTLQQYCLALPAMGVEVPLRLDWANPDAFAQSCAIAQALNVSLLVACGGFNALKRRVAFDHEYAGFAQSLNQHARIAADHGCRLAFHPHLKCIVETDAELDRLLQHAPDVDLCLDTGHLIAAGTNPVAFLHQHAPRITHIHLKDWDPDAEVFQEIGQGSAGLDFPAFFAALDAVGYNGWVVVERDSPQLPPLESARLSKAGVDAALINA
ncbi:MAG: TIM barrel protein [Planctomycetota bacterium]